MDVLIIYSVQVKPHSASVLESRKDVSTCLILVTVNVIVVPRVALSLKKACAKLVTSRALALATV